MKDFYDLDWLSRHHDFSQVILQSAIQATFQRRNSPLPKTLPLALTSEFSTDPAKVVQWNAFLRKNRFKADTLATVITRLHEFLERPLLSTEEGKSFHWNPNTGWTETSLFAPAIIQKPLSKPASKAISPEGRAERRLMA